jgi:23S rRNA pseudouridine1911/1915/1917 synthase
LNNPTHFALRKIELIHEDEDLLIMNKPSFLLSIPDRNNEKQSMLGLLREKYERVFTVHRLDFETSGLICFAKNEHAHQSLSVQFEKRQTIKIYHAIVEGRMMQQEGIIDLSITEDLANKGKMKIARDGKPSLSEYRLLERFRHFSYVEINLKTGRTHQARVHMKAIGFPMAVDKDYGNKEAFYLSQIKKKFKEGKWEEEQPMVSHTTLHAYSLTFTHPSTHALVTYTAPLRKDMSVMLKYLREFDAER